MLSCAILLLLTACSHHDSLLDSEPTMLYIHVYSPEKPYTTRADIGDVTASVSESQIHSLRIWVFWAEEYTDLAGNTYNVGDLVGYLQPADDELDKINLGGGDTYMMAVSDAFALKKPNVDVYVLANAESYCNVTLDANTTKSALDAIRMEHTATSDPFGTTVVYRDDDSNVLPKPIPDAGLPMSGKLLNKPVYGTSPILRIGESEESHTIAHVPLVRMVSRVKFIFSRLQGGNEYLEISSIKIVGSLTDAGADADIHLPKYEYMFFNPPYTHRNYNGAVEDTDYETEDIVFIDKTTLSNELIDFGNKEGYSLDDGYRHDICSNDHIYDFRYVSQSGQDYETLIGQAVSDNELTLRGPYYMRETDKRLRGVINYRVVSNYSVTGGVVSGEEESHEATFLLNEPLDFSRNHSWIVYIYYHGGGKLDLHNVYVTDWGNVGNTSHQVYNW